MNTTKILVVDDTLDLLDLYSIWLREAGYKVVPAASGTECLRLVAEELPDLVLLDVMLPDLDGIEVCKTIKTNQLTAAIPVINISGRLTSADNKAEGLEAGADGYLTKPFDARTLLAHVRALLRMRQTEEALNRSEERFRAAFDNALDAMLIADDNANTVDANPSACAMFGVTKEEMLQRKLSDFVDAGRRPEVERAWQAFLKEGEQSGGFRLSRPDGTTRELEYRAKARFLPNRHLSILRDVTRRKQIEEELRLAHVELEKRVEQRTTELVAANSFLKNEIIEHQHTEQALRESEEHIRLMVDGIKDYAIFLLDTEGRIASWNEGAARLKGYRSDEIIGKPHSICFTAEDIREGKPELALKVAAAEGRNEDEYWKVRKDKSRFWANVIITALRDDEHRLRGFVDITRDISERKRVEDALRQSEEQYRELVENISDIIYATDDKGVVTYASPAILSTGFKLYEVIGHPFSEFIYPEDLPQTISSFQQSAFGHSEPLEFRLLTKTGGIRWVSKSSLPVFHGDRFAGTRGLLVDITERKRAQEALQSTNQMLQTLIYSSPLAIVVQEQDGNVNLWNPAAEQMLGWTEAEVLGRPNPLVPNGKEADFEALRQDGMVGSSAVTGLEKIRHRKDGSPIYLSSAVAPLSGADGGSMGTVTIMADITERKRAEEKLRETNETLRTLIQASPLAIVGLDPAGIVTMWNPAAEYIFGWTKEEALGRPLPSAPEDKQDEFRALREGVMRGEASTDMQIRRTRKDGSLIDISLSTAPLRDAEGKIIGMMGIMANIMDRKRIEEERAQLLRRLVTTQEEEQRRLSRELHDQTGQSLAALMLGLKSIEDSNQLEEDARSRLRHLQELTNQLAHDVHHLASNLRPTALDDLGLHTALSNYVEEWSGRSKIRADYHSNGLMKERLPRLIETAVYRIVQEALTNVLKHANAQNVSVIVEHRGNRVQAIVEDDGIGFNAEGRLSATNGERRLGLLGMQERVALVDGDLTIESTPGSGSTVIVHIPVSTKQSEADTK
ncbi:MAG: hybrid sensor histidine kinase/response regulator [Pyrinomonadaceae bacterium]